MAALEHNHILAAIATWLDKTVGRQDVIVLLIGLVSAVVDNVPLVAASMGMYSLAQYPADSFLWEFMAYCAGTGGSILIIGSAAGVAAMGLEKIDFIWYMKKISGLARWATLLERCFMWRVPTDALTLPSAPCRECRVVRSTLGDLSGQI